MKKKKICLALAVLSVLAFGMTAFAAGTDDAMTAIRSQGALVYRSAAGNVALYSDDIALLAEKISTMPEETYDPHAYAHTHVWDYTDREDGVTHTQHCTVCGETLTCAHAALSMSACTITCDGVAYEGWECSCACGYQWQIEQMHNYVYTVSAENDAVHTVHCALSGTDYCDGMVSFMQEHLYADATPDDDATHTEICLYCGRALTQAHTLTDMTADSDGEHHTQTCAVCGVKVTEDCEYTYEEESETDEETGILTVRLYCECGNARSYTYQITLEEEDDAEEDTNGLSQ